MSNQPTTTNSTATTVNGAISTAVQDGEKVVCNLIVADIAVWTGPMAPIAAFAVDAFIKPFVSPVVSYIGKKFSIYLQTLGTFTVVDVQVEKEKSNMSAELVALQAAEKTGNTDAIKKAIQDYANAQSAIVNDDGSAVPH